MTAKDTAKDSHDDDDYYYHSAGLQTTAVPTATGMRSCWHVSKSVLQCHRAVIGTRLISDLSSAQNSFLHPRQMSLVDDPSGPQRAP